MTYDERCKLEAYLRAKKPISWIAKELGFCERSIYYEIKRGTYEHERGAYLQKRYSADKAQQIYEYNQTAKGRPLKIGNDRAYANFLENKILNDKYSPAAALVSAKANGFTTSVCLATLYSYIDKRVFLHLTNKDLWEKGKRKKRRYNRVRRIVHPKYPSIEDRPNHINERQDLGHWEIDLVIGQQRNKAALMVMTERVTREIIIRKIPNKTSAAIITELDKLEKTMPNFRSRIQTITTDNGSEFLDYEGLRRSIYDGERCEIYYCHSYASWEKGTIERNNRIIRRFFPKGTDFTKVTKKQVAAVQDWMNNYPRKILGWKTPAEMTA